MAIQQENGRFTFKNAIGTLVESVSAIWKPAFVAAPLIGTALFFASGTQAQTSGSAVASPAPAANGTVAPITSPDAARRKGPKVKTKTATNDRVANPTPAAGPAADAPVAPIASPEAARTGRPKIRDKEATGRVASPPATTEPVVQPEAARTGRPKVRDNTPMDTSRTGRPKERDPTPTNDRVANPTTEPTGRRREGPKGDGGHGRTSTTPLIIGALGAAAVLALVVSSGNDRPASP